MEINNQEDFLQTVRKALGRGTKVEPLDEAAYRTLFPSHLNAASKPGEGKGNVASKPGEGKGDVASKPGEDKENNASKVVEEEGDGASKVVEEEGGGVSKVLKGEGACGPNGSEGQGSMSEKLELLEALKEKGAPINLYVSLVPDKAAAAWAIRELAAEKSTEWGGEKQVAVWDHPLVNSLGLEGELAKEKIPVAGTLIPDLVDAGTEDKKKVYNKVVDSFMGVTSADYLVAETGTLVNRTRPHQPRMVSLVPSIHVAVVEFSRVLTDFHDLYTHLEREQLEDPNALTRSLTFITGPSRTGDIELVMVNGAHGPREVHLYILTGEL